MPDVTRNFEFFTGKQKPRREHRGFWVFRHTELDFRHGEGRALIPTQIFFLP